MSNAHRASPLATFAIIIVINAVIQSLLILPEPIFGLNTPLFIGLATIAGLLVWIIPGLIVAALFPFVGIAIADGSRHPFSANFQAIRARFGAFVAALAATFIVLVLMYLASVVLVIFLPTAVAALLTWLYVGLIGVWLIRSWVRLYRRATAIRALTSQPLHV